MHPTFARNCIALFVCILPVNGQTFDVASIRPSGPASVRGSDGGPGDRDPIRYIFNRATLMDLIVVAWDVEEFQVSSRMPLDRDEFDLDTRLPDGATQDQFQIMLRNFLADRFRLRAHLETRDFDAFALTPAKEGPKLGNTPAARETLHPGFPDLSPGKPGIAAGNSISGGFIVTRIRARKEPVPMLAQLLRIGVDRSVVDATGLEGTYDFTLEYSRELPNATASPAADPSLPDLSTALREQLGLQLVARKASFPVVVVEAVDRSPSAN